MYDILSNLKILQIRCISINNIWKFCLPDIDCSKVSLTVQKRLIPLLYLFCCKLRSKALLNFGSFI